MQWLVQGRCKVQWELVWWFEVEDGVVVNAEVCAVAGEYSM